MQVKELPYLSVEFEFLNKNRSSCPVARLGVSQLVLRVIVEENER